MSPARCGACITRRPSVTPSRGSDAPCGRTEWRREDDVGRGPRRDVMMDERGSRGDRDWDDGYGHQTSGGHTHETCGAARAGTRALMLMMVTAVSGALGIRVVSLMAGGHRISHRAVHRPHVVVAMHAGSGHSTEPPAAVLRARRQRNAGDRGDHPEPEESRKKPVCQGPPHERQSRGTLRKGQTTGNL
jgi:hypothetical protein